MICPVCKVRWAPYPKNDWCNSDVGVIPLNETALEKRETIWDNNIIVTCRECSL